MHDKIGNMHLQKYIKGGCFTKEMSDIQIKQFDFLSCPLVSLFPIFKNMKINKAMSSSQR